MVNSLFVLNLQGDVIIEKHWRGLISRSVCDTFWLTACKAASFADVLPITPVGGRYHVIHLKVPELWYLAVIEKDESPLMVVEFLQRVDEVFKDYFKTVNEAAIKDNFVCVYQLLEEMMDNGMPFNTEPNQLRAMIAAPGAFHKPLSDLLSGETPVTGDALPEGSLSAIPWRRVGVKYAANEIYFDIIEDIEAIVDAGGSVVSSEVNGRVQCTCKLSGMPDLVLAYRNPRILDDVSFHPCVRVARWEASKTLSFIPPDGVFKLMEYRVRSQISFPVLVKPTVSFLDGVGKITVTVTAKVPSDITVENVRVTIPWEKCVSSCSVSSATGKIEYNERSKVATWDIGRMQAGKSVAMSGSVHLSGGIKHINPTIDIDFKVAMFSASGLKVESLAVHNASYKPYKGVRAITKAGRFQYRT